MPLAPEITAFGDGDHEIGESGIPIDGGGFEAFPGRAVITENADRSGALDELTIVSWNDLQIVVDIPAVLNNTAGTRHLSVQREDLAWSQAFAFTLSDAAELLLAGTMISESAMSARAQVDPVLSGVIASESVLSGDLQGIGVLLLAGTMTSESELSGTLEGTFVPVDVIIADSLKLVPALRADFLRLVA